jgi:RNA polymerase sigma factor (sigma-70 family)
VLVQQSLDKTHVDSKPQEFTASNPHAAIPEWQDRFMQLVPRIRRYAEMRFRGLSGDAHDDMVQETIARALVDFLRLRERNKESMAYATPLARFAVAHVQHGRRVGNRLNARDVSSEYCQRRQGILRHSLDSDDGCDKTWHEALLESKHSSPAEVATARIDVARWLATLPKRSRKLAECLAVGNTTASTARSFGVSPGRVSQLRRELCEAWYAFQGEAVPVGH